MSGVMPLRLDPLKAADRGLSLQGEIALASLERLAPLLLENDGDVSCQFAFYRDENGARKLRLSYRAELVLSCQRCLGPVKQLVEGESLLHLVDADVQTENPDEDVLLVGTEEVYLADILEDELLLALPLIPRHATLEECEPDATHWLQPDDEKGTIEAQTGNPFDILKNLKH